MSILGCRFTVFCQLATCLCWAAPFSMVRFRRPAGTHTGASGRGSQVRSGLKISACGGPSIQVTFIWQLLFEITSGFLSVSRCGYDLLSVLAVLRTCLIPTSGPTMHSSDSAEPIFSV